VKRLNLGCGKDVRGDWINHDIKQHDAAIDVVWDLNKIPWPWDDSSVDMIHAISVLEHLKLTFIESLDECWRILKPGGALYVKFPIYTSPFIHHDPTHRWFWDESTPNFVDPATDLGKRYSYYTTRKWETLDKKVTDKNCWITLRPLKK